MQPGNRIGIRLALALAAYHRRFGTRVPDGDLGFRCPLCGKVLIAREFFSESVPAHFDHFDINSTCRLARFGTFAADRSETLDRYLTPGALRAVMREYLARRSDGRDEAGDGDARVRSPLRSAPSGRSSSASVPEPEDDGDVAAVAEFRKGFHTRTS